MSTLLEVDNLRISARNDDDELIPIVKGVSFNVARGEVVALIGESGSGKTTIALSSLGYTKPCLFYTSDAADAPLPGYIARRRSTHKSSPQQ